jgi:hypothetical protein
MEGLSIERMHMQTYFKSKAYSNSFSQFTSSFSRLMKLSLLPGTELFLEASSNPAGDGFFQDMEAPH